MTYGVLLSMLIIHPAYFILGLVISFLCWVLLLSHLEERFVIIEQKKRNIAVAYTIVATITMFIAWMVGVYGNVYEYFHG